MINTDKIFSIKNDTDFLDISLDIFRFQAKNCEPYKRWINLLGIDTEKVGAIEEIPFLPIELFKSEKVYCSPKKEEIIFTSSSTTGTGQSFHYVKDVLLYQKSFSNSFNLFYGPPHKYAILGLLPSYMERKGSSLIYMVDDLIKQSGSRQSGYFLHNFDNLFETLKKLKSKNTPTILIGVTYALLDFVEKRQINFPELIVMETGGMKGKRKEISRNELHSALQNGFGVSKIHSEYGMTELLSQAYSNGFGVFYCPPWMKVLIRDIYNPLKLTNNGETGAINVIDLANINSCSFIATQDIGKLNHDNSFEVLGRLASGDVRGCNLLVQ